MRSSRGRLPGTVAGHYQVVFRDWQLAVRKNAGQDLLALG